VPPVGEQLRRLPVALGLRDGLRRAPQPVAQRAVRAVAQQQADHVAVAEGGRHVQRGQAVGRRAVRVRAELEQRRDDVAHLEVRAAPLGVLGLHAQQRVVGAVQA
jgi:hypothetical protein